jgi:hypothetical protein
MRSPFWESAFPAQGKGQIKPSLILKEVTADLFYQYSLAREPFSFDFSLLVKPFIASPSAYCYKP